LTPKKNLGFYKVMAEIMCVVEKALPKSKGGGGTFPIFMNLDWFMLGFLFWEMPPHIGPSLLLDGYIEFNISAKKGK
jgi:hypothetical protein